MKFGTTTLPIAGWLVDPLNPEQAREQRLEAIRQLVYDYNLSAVELTLDFGLIFPDIFNQDFYASVAALQQVTAFTCSVHLPQLWLDPASLNDTMRRASVGCLRQAIELTEPVEVNSYVLHLWGFSTLQIMQQLEAEQQQVVTLALKVQAERSLAEVCEFVDPLKVCMENLEAPGFEVILPLVEKFGVRICLDVGHLAFQDGGELEIFRQYRARIGEVHLHDARNLTERNPRQVRDHLPLGEGEIDFVTFLRELEDSQFAGPVILELNRKVDLEKSLIKLQDWLV